MDDKKYYTSGEFAKKANITIRTIRYYDKQGILSPTFRNNSGYRFYSDEDFIKLQKILTLKYLGFSLEEIRTMTLYDSTEEIEESLELQIQLVKKRKEHLELMEKNLIQTKEMFQRRKDIKWDEILNLIHVTNMERELVEQYKTANNLNIRIELHNKYSTNLQGWFPWLYSQICFDQAETILELGCGNGALWINADWEKLSDKQICLSDISKGMIKEAKQNLEKENGNKPGFKKTNIKYKAYNAEKLSLEKNSEDIVIANHVLFYIKNLDCTIKNIADILKENGTFYCSTYGFDHLHEITELAKEFDSRITLSQVNLQEQFGIENGKTILEPYFSRVELKIYEDSLIINRAEPLVDYILSCHGNQKEILSGRYQEFCCFVEEKIKRFGAIFVTKQAGVFICRK